MIEKLLQIKNISVHYGGVKALENVSFFVDEGEIVALMGPNGAGKSTALKSIFGIANISSGEILFHGKKVNPLPHEMVERGISFVPQGRRVFKFLTVKENLEVGGFIVKDKKIIKNRIDEILSFFPNLKNKLNQKSGELSGGQQQMVAIARGLMTDPKILLLDEPSLGLSPKVTKEVFDKIKEINEARKTAIVIVEHNLKSLLPIVDRAYVFDKGSIVHQGIGREVIESDVLEKVFLGRFGK